MKVNVLKLKGKIIEANTTQEGLADDIGIDRSTFYRKIKAEGKAFTIGEMHSIVDALGLSREEAIEIFLNK